MINERLNDIIFESVKYYESDAIKITKNPKTYLQMIDALDQFSDDFLEEFINELKSKVKIICNLIIKDETELFKFMSFILNFLINLDSSKKVFVSYILFVKKAFSLMSENNFDTLINIIDNFLIPFLICKMKLVSNESLYFIFKVLSFTFADDT